MKKTETSLSPSGKGSSAAIFVPDKGSIHGRTPFLRAVTMMGATTVITMILGYGAYRQWILSPPDRLITSWDIVWWMMTSLLVPYAVTFTLSLAGSIFILSQREMRYVWWVITQAVIPIINYLLLSIMMGTLFLGIFFDGITPRTSLDNSLNPILVQVWYIGMILCVFHAWLGYRSGWKIYRVFGAQTMQQRYESSLADMERDVSGRLWDRYIEKYYLWITGKDGHKPRMGLVFFLLSISIVVCGVSFSAISGASFTYPFVTVGFSCFIVFFFAAVSKWVDGRYNRKKEPFLHPFRDRDTEDTYDPSSKGRRFFQ